MYYFEVRRTVKRDMPPKYVLGTELSAYTGFRSVYGLSEASVQWAVSRVSTAGLSSHPVYSDTLFLDFDGLLGVPEVEAVLAGLKVGYEVWSTGRRGVHVHVPIAPMWGVCVPQAQLAWVKANVSGDWDPTLYRHNSLIRLPGTWHEKNPGHRKELVKRVSGALLEVPAVVPSVPKAPTSSAEPVKFWGLVYAPKPSPGRTHRLFALARSAAEAGVSESVAWEACTWWAANRASPNMPIDSEFLRVFHNGYKVA